MNLSLMKRHFLTLGVFAGGLVFDIITKFIVNTRMNEFERINVIGSFIQFTKLYNKGGVFGIMQGHQRFFLVVSMFVLCLLLLFYLFERKKGMLFSVAMGLVFSGAVGNILDRALGRPGVVDFIYIGIDRFWRWPAFNVADSSIVVGALLLIFVFYRHEKQIDRTSHTTEEKM
jgi:signal peptidase II